MQQTSKFQYIFLGLLIVAIVGGVFIFSQGRSGTIPLARITIWGSLPQNVFAAYADLATKNNPNLTITYIYKKAETFDTELVEALASGKGPDVVIMPLELIIRHKDKLYPIPYQSLSERNFKDVYIQESELYLTPEGILSLPFTVDPLVLYWNRDVFSNASITTPPRYWDEFYALSEKLTNKDAKLAILHSAAALGEFVNVTHAKEILSALFIQAGTPITGYDENGSLKPQLASVGAASYLPAESALGFYTQFANPVKSFYSWNRSLPASKDMFLAGDLATYVGFASEYKDLRDKNPNLNFDVTYLPQARDQKTSLTYGNLSGFAILKSSRAVSDAFTTVYVLTSKANMTSWLDLSGLPPVRRDMLAEIPTTATGAVFYNSALWSRGWLDPNPEKTASIFKTMVENVLSGRARVSEAVETADKEMKILLP